MQQQIATLQEQLLTQRGVFEYSQKTFKEETEDLKLKTKNMQNVLVNYEAQVSSLMSELAKTTSNLQNEQSSCETLRAELKSTHTLLAGAEKEAKAARSETERMVLWEKEHKHLKDKHTRRLWKECGRFLRLLYSK